MSRTIRCGTIWTTVGLVMTMTNMAALASVASASPSADHVGAVTRTASKHAPAGLESGDDHYCDGCTPPLVYSGGPVMDTSGPAGLTITPIYWAPDDATPFPDGYQDIINGYLADVAAASGATDNVYSINTEYYETVDGADKHISYAISAGEPVIDTQPFPADGCAPDSGFTSCITDDQLRKELTAITGKLGLTTDISNFYPVFLPPGVETADNDGSNSASSFCGYHNAYGEGANMIVYGNEPYEEEGCDGGQAPNGDLAADGAVGTLSHEINEALTDPTDAAAWVDSTGHEIGDICANDYGTALGSTDESNPESTQYNQVINGGFYYTQTEFSNAAFAAFGIGNGCVQSSHATTAQETNDPTAVASVFTFAFPNALEADGSTTSEISTSVSDADQNVIAGDTVNFSVYAVEGNGQCGTLSAELATTGADGYATVTYTASTDDIICAVVATDAQGGQSSIGTVYQGAAQDVAPTAHDTFPTSLAAGAEPTMFTTVFTNPGTKSIVNAQIDFSIFPGENATSNVTAEQVALSFSTDGPDGPFTTVVLSGSTVQDGGIEGTLGDQGGTTLEAGSTLTVTYLLSLDASVSTEAAGPLLSFEAYLDQINPGSGAGTNLADTGSTDIEVFAAGEAPTGSAVHDTVVNDTVVNDTVGADTAGADSAGADTAGAIESETTTTAAADTTVTTAPAKSDESSSAPVVIGVIALVVLVAGIGIFVATRKRKS